MKNTQDIFRFLGQLPQQMGIEMAPHLPTPELISISMTSKGHRAFFKPVLEERKVLQKFLYHTVRGEHDAVKEMLSNDISLIFKRGQVTDCSGRTFDNISAFEFVLWALDKPMWTMMLNCLPITEDGKKVIVKLLCQYDKVSTEGVTYVLNGKTVTETHFDFKNTIIKELQSQVDSIAAQGDKNFAAIDKQWREGVGGAQRLLPMHAVYEYCSHDPFHPVSKFTGQPKSSGQFYNSETRQYENWFVVDSRLGVDFAIYKYRAKHTRSRIEAPLFSFRSDLSDLRALSKASINGFINLKFQLEKQMALDSHPGFLSFD
ncbi:hypothetical protein TUM19329_14910 [Legionella antarctica]|uniref:SidC homolog n=1 Tax=Legionella antarctica TaxID=2708020 RepID=A0A6F8T4P7_9GAMM|nr:F-box protein [Legionella antarctica]BCA95130.1 hypothetical protein TUM19329_14910 [Legionella antarctica]